VEPFLIEIDSLSQAKTLVFAYKIAEKDEDAKFVIGEKQ
jgi:hypothetical protein